MKDDQQKKLASTLLIFDQNQDHYLNLLAFLTKNDLLETNQNQIKAENILNLHLINQNQEGLKIKQVRELIQEAAFASVSQKPRIIAILYAQQGSTPAQNALLKIVEEPPQNTIIILTTSFPQQIITTIKSRCVVKHYSNQEKQEAFLSDDLLKEANMILGPSFSYSQALKLAEKYKKREEALDWLTQVINFLHSQLGDLPQANSTEKITAVLKSLLKCHQEIQQNLNTHMSLEHHLFGIIQNDN